MVRGQRAAHHMAQAGTTHPKQPSEGPWVCVPAAHPPVSWVGTHVLQAGAVLVLVQVVLLPEAQQVVEVVEQEAGVLLAVLHPLQQPQVQGQPLFPSGQHQDHQAGVEATDVLLQGPSSPWWTGVATGQGRGWPKPVPAEP